MENSKLYKALIDRDEYDFLKLLQTDEDVNVRDVDGKTLLHMAVLKLKTVEVFKALLSKIDFSIRDEDGNTAVDLMMADEDFPDAGESVLRQVVIAKMKAASKQEMEELLHRGWLDMWMSAADVDDDKDDDVKDFVKTLPDNLTKVQVLHKAIRDGEVEIVVTMADKHLRAADRTGLPPLHKAVVLGQTEIVEELAKIPGALTITDNMGRTALHHAAGRRDGGHYYQILTDAGADPSVADVNERTAQEIYENPELLPGEKMYEKVIAALDRPVLTSKVRSSQEGDQTGSRNGSPSADEQGQRNTSKKTKPVKMYISPDCRHNPPPTTVDGQYVAEHLGSALTHALSEIAERRPWDPIEYLAQWLYKYHENMTHNKKQAELLAQIRAEEAERERELEAKEKRLEELRRLQEIQRQKEQEEEEERKKKEQEELQRKAKEAALSQRPGLATVAEEKEEEAPKEKSHKDENGQTELHKLASQTAADLTTLLNMGYLPSDRDSNNKTARDIAEESGRLENVEAIDNYIRKLVEMQDFDALQELVLAGYDKFDVALDAFKQSTSLPEDTQEFLKDLPDLKVRITAVFKAVQAEGIRDLQQSLERKKLIKAKDEFGRSPLHMAVLGERKQAVEHIITTFPAAMKSTDNLERTPLHYAMALSEDLSQLLESHGADTLAQDVKQRKPSYYKEYPDDIQTMTASLSLLPPPEQAPEAEPDEEHSQGTLQQEAPVQETDVTAQE